MLSHFDLKTGVDLGEVQQALSGYAVHMVEKELLLGVDPIGIRHRDTILDTDDERSQHYFLLMHFRDREQSEQAVQHIETAEEPAASLHRALYSKMENLVFVCWQDA